MSHNLAGKRQLKESTEILKTLANQACHEVQLK